MFYVFIGWVCDQGQMRQCWICYLEESVETEEDDKRWVQPCKCKGSTHWVHQDCLLAWINSRLSSGEDVNQVVREAGGPLVTPPDLCCPQCHTPYRVAESYLIPRSVLYVIDKAIEVKESVVFVSLIGSVCGSVWLLCLVHGATTFVVTVGLEDAKNFCWSYLGPLYQFLYEDGDLPSPRMLIRTAFRLLVGIPNIPLIMLASKFPSLLPIPLKVPLLLLALEPISTSSWTPRTTAFVTPFVYDVYVRLRRRWFADQLFAKPRRSSSAQAEEDDDEQAAVMIRVSEDSFSWLLMMPIVSSAVGWLLFRRLPISRFHKTCLGGVVTILATDAGRVLYKYQADYLKRSRRVLDY